MLPTNQDRLLTVRALGFIVPPNAPGHQPDPSGANRFRPGQGSIVLNVAPGDLALPWESDHLEPGVSLAHPEPAANRALQILSCVGNSAIVAGGAARGARGTVVGKHGTVLVRFEPDALALLMPGDPIAIDTHGVGLHIDGFPAVHLHSTSPRLLQAFASLHDGRLRLRAVAVLPPETAAAGLGMEASWANIDLETHDPELTAEAGLAALRFGDLIVLREQDHRHARRHDPDWIALGVISHGASVSGGHGLGMATLLTAPVDQVEIEIYKGANVVRLLG